MRNVKPPFSFSPNLSRHQSQLWMCSLWGANQSWCCSLTFSVFFSLYFHLRTHPPIRPCIYMFCRPVSLSSSEISSICSLSLSLSRSLSYCLLSFLSFLIFFTLVGTAAALRVEGPWLGRGENWLWDRQTQNWVIIVCVWEARSPDEKLQDKRSKWHSIQRRDVSGLQIMLKPSFT